MLKKILSISCKKATFLASKKEAGKISMADKIKLKLHYTICDGCKLFAKQSSFIVENSKQLHLHHNESLSNEKKEKMKKIMKDSGS